MSLINESSTTCAFWSMFNNSSLFGTSLSLIKTASKARGLANQRLKHRLDEVGGFFGTKKATALPSPYALTC